MRIPSGDAPPSFFARHGGDDTISPPQNSVLMYLALKTGRRPPAELHIYGGTAHDFRRPRESDIAPTPTWDGGQVRPTGCNDLGLLRANGKE